MFYCEDEARELVIEAGHRLVEEKLVARTWGNISARISENCFVITPSGREYGTLKPSDLVKVNADDCSWEGNIKPSSEKGIHAIAYRLREDVSFIIHTHQLYATAISTEGKDVPFAPCVGYALSGTAALRKKVLFKIKENPGMKAFLMTRHGVLCLGNNYDEAFEQVETLEENSQKLFMDKTKEIKPQNCMKPFLDDYAQIMGNGKTIPEDESDETIRLIMEKNRAAALYMNYRGWLNGFDVFLQHFIYRKKYSKLKGKS